MDLDPFLQALIPSWTSVGILGSYFAYLALIGSVLPGKIVPGAVLQDGTRLYYRCNGLLSLFVLVGLLGMGAWTNYISPTIIAERGWELFSATFLLSTFITFALYVSGRMSKAKGSSLKSHATGNFIHDWYFDLLKVFHFGC